MTVLHPLLGPPLLWAFDGVGLTDFSHTIESDFPAFSFSEREIGLVSPPLLGVLCGSFTWNYGIYWHHVSTQTKREKASFNSQLLSVVKADLRLAKADLRLA